MQRVYQHGERWCRLSPAGEMKARKRRAPIGKSPDQPARSDVLLHTVLWHEGQAVTGNRGSHGHRRGIERQPTLDSHA
jgi:hypothetical protein